MNLFGSVTAVAEFVGGGVFPWAKVESVKLFNRLEGFGYVIFGAEFLFAFATFYYLVNIITTVKREGMREFTKNSFHMSDVFTVFMSILALGDLLKRIDNKTIYILFRGVSVLSEPPTLLRKAIFNKEKSPFSPLPRPYVLWPLRR